MIRDRSRARAAFVDRDGTLNELVLRDGVLGSPRRLEDLRLRPEASAFVDRLRALGLSVYVVTNQPDVARGTLPAEVLEEMTRTIRASLHVDDIQVCPHDDADRCACRKPEPGMLLHLAARDGLDLRRSFMIGDTWKDIEAGRRAGCRTIRVGGGPAASPDADVVVPGLLEAADAVAAAHAARSEDVKQVHP